MNGMNNQHDHYREFQIQRDQRLGAARREHLLRIALQRSPKTLRLYHAALTRLIATLFR
jgi:hypothetical protein